MDVSTPPDKTLGLASFPAILPSVLQEALAVLQYVVVDPSANALRRLWMWMCRRRHHHLSDMQFPMHHKGLSSQGGVGRWTDPLTSGANVFVLFRGGGPLSQCVPVTGESAAMGSQMPGVQAKLLEVRGGGSVGKRGPWSGS